MHRLRAEVLEIEQALQTAHANKLELVREKLRLAEALSQATDILAGMQVCLKTNGCTLWCCLIGEHGMPDMLMTCQNGCHARFLLLSHGTLSVLTSGTAMKNGISLW